MKVPLPLLPQGSRLVQGAAGVAVTSALTWMMLVSTNDNDEVNNENRVDESSTQKWVLKLPQFKVYGSSSELVNSLISNAWSVRRTRLESQVPIPSYSQEAGAESILTAATMPITNNHRTYKAPSVIEYDFIVVGHGNAGKRAIETLQQQCPGATIALVDPLRSPVQSPSSNNKKLRYYSQPALGFHPPTRTVELAATSTSTDYSTPSPIMKLKYRHAILIATGSRGAPPPMALMDQQILNRVLELRPTEMPGNANQRPVLPPETIRHLSLLAASQGAKVCVLGSGWEALELAVAVSHASSSSASLSMLAFGSAGPLSHLLPRYLSTAVTKRLRLQGMDIQERALVRYVSHHTVRDTINSNKHGASRMEVHTAKSFDLLDTQRNLVDLLVVAPHVDGPRGTAVLPMLTVPDPFLEDHRLGRTWYQSWSQLSSPPSEPSTVVCYADDGRISVNAELNAASKVYAAGSVAKYPNSVTGHAHVAGEGSVDGALAGRLAALHMARDYQERTTRSSLLLRKDSATTIEPASFASKSFPIFRSDISPYNPAKGHQSSLSKAGIKALVVGHCDSEKMSTHGFWWTNVADKRHRHQTMDGADARRKKTRKAQTGSSSSQHPIYGSGIVYYLDRAGRIRGVMSWGFPITTPSSSINNNDADSSEDLNHILVDRMMEIIRTNGGITRSQEDPLLKPSHLAEESQHLAELALFGSGNNNRRRRLTAKINRMSKPLHRYTAAKPPRVASIGLLKRKDQSSFSELLGENIYIKDDDTYNEVDRLRPPSLLYIYPMHSPIWHSLSDSEEESKWQNPYLLSQDDRTDQAWKDNERRARPPKEEPLWLRRGDALRSVSIRDVMNETFLSNMRSGRFADGSEPFQRAKAPKAVQEASKKLRSFAGGATDTTSTEPADGN